MAINIPSKKAKQESQIRDALRILAWQAYKAENQNIRGLEGYEQFLVEWNEHEVQKMDLPKLTKLIGELGYTVNELINIRNEYYSVRRSRDNGDNGFVEQSDTNSPVVF
ncbi:hypothetical protein [Microseira sp. BLCC-F43]|jgi:hypothetical protein|uniref:hypothetical protein n=1 Tax=Microseira sp. BLCC-F43 TaxID=3153602 RepID=UPI0035B7737E